MLSSKESACNERDMGSISELGRFPGGKNDNPLPHAGLGNPMDREPEGHSSRHRKAVEHDLATK